MLYFFLSYARGGDDVYVRMFFDDLSEEVRSLAGLREDTEVGFLDNHNIHPGDRWPEALVSALSRCRSFLPLCSPRYFYSEPCGKEWTIFAERVRRHEALSKTRSSTLIPIRWQHSPQMPQVALPIQYVDEPPRDHDQRASRGVRQLLRLNRNRDDYLEFVSSVAELIVNAAHVDPLPEGLTGGDFDAVPSAFHPAPAGVETALPPPNGLPASAGADRVHFVVSAPTAAAASSSAVGRRQVGYYGSEPELWAPYQPKMLDPLGSYASRIAEERQLRPSVVAVDQLDECLNEAHRNNQVVVLLVDAWSTKLPENQEILVQYDGREDRPAAVMIPFSSADAETQDHAAELYASVERAFPNRARQPENTRFRRSVLTPQSFDADLQAVLEESRNRVFARGVPRRAIPARTTERPILEGP